MPSDLLAEMGRGRIRPGIRHYGIISPCPVDSHALTNHEKLDYMRKNPITRGLVDRPEQRAWSSYRYYEFGDELLIAMDWDASWPIV
jgi:hypothetical protein